MKLVERFEDAARAAAATVDRVPRDPSRIADAISRAFPDAQKIVIAEPVHLSAHLFDGCRRLPGVIQSRAPRSGFGLKAEMATIDLGVTEAFAGVARTGSICIDVNAGLNGYASLLGRVHVAVLAAEDIVERPGDLFPRDAARTSKLDRNFVFVTGPSATADMGPLVRGVHGPHRLHILLMEEE